MRCFLMFVFALATLGVTASTFGHGFVITLSGNQIVGQSNDFPTLPASLFDTNAAEPNPGTFPTTYRAASGSIEASTGFNVNPMNPPVDTFRFDFLGGLWHSSGGTATAADAAVRLNANSATSPAGADLLGNSNGAAGFALAGISSHEVTWWLIGTSSSLNDIPGGAYGAVLQVSGTSGNGNPFLPTGPLVVVFKTPDFTDLTAFANARDAIYAAAVPEPAGVLLAAIGAGGAAALFMRRVASSQC